MGLDVIDHPVVADMEDAVGVEVLLGAVAAIGRVAADIDPGGVQLRRCQGGDAEPSDEFAERPVELDAADVEIRVGVLHPAVDGGEPGRLEAAEGQGGAVAPGADLDGVGPAAMEALVVDVMSGGDDGARSGEPSGAGGHGAGRGAHAQGADHAPGRQFGVEDALPVVGADGAFEGAHLDGADAPLHRLGAFAGDQVVGGGARPLDRRGAAASDPLAVLGPRRNRLAGLGSGLADRHQFDHLCVYPRITRVELSVGPTGAPLASAMRACRRRSARSVIGFRSPVAAGAHRSLPRPVAAAASAQER